MSRRQKIKLSLFFSVISLLGLIFLLGLTSPIKNISFALVFFTVLFLFLASFGHLLIYSRRGELGPKSRSRIVIFSIFVVLLLMF
ncbi:MAG TPA: hypothetical protein VI336_00590, partial [Candidatus Saccharimonadales bacterium]|nr:hypothetical protein [Candidatus Saccharimonadales bacterium]